MPSAHDNLARSHHAGARGALVQHVRWRLLTWLAAATLIVGTGAAARAQNSVDLQREYNVKAVSLYAFGRYVTWPDAAFESDESPVVIGVVGGNPFGDALDRIAARKTLNGRPMSIKQLANPNEVAGMHIVFVTRSTSPEVEAEVLKRTAGKPVLVVGETPGFAERGGIVNFFLSGANVKFELNPERGAACQLHLDAKLLSLGAKAQAQAQ
jgi:hypothetical protein